VIAMHRPNLRGESGQVGWLFLGIVLGIVLVFWAVFALIF
jgi:hypothetical protein